MTLEKIAIRRMVLLGALATGVLAIGALLVITRAAAAQTPSSLLVITSKIKGSENGVLLMADPLTRKIVGRVSLGGPPHDVAVSADGKFAFTTNIVRRDAQVYDNSDRDPRPADFISVVDLAAQKEVRRVEIGPGSNPHGIIVGGGKVYFTAEGYKLIGRYDPETNRIDWMAGINQHRTHCLVLTKDTKRIFISNIASDTVAAIAPWDPATDFQTYDKNHPATTWNITLIPTANAPEGIAMSPNEKEVWVLTRTNGSVSIIDVATKKVSHTLNLKTKDPLRLTFTPDGNRVLIADYETGEVLIVDAVTRKEIKRIKDVGKGIHGIVVSPDGSLAYATAPVDENVAIIDMKTLEVTGRIPTAAGTESLAWVERR